MAKYLSAAARDLNVLLSGLRFQPYYRITH